MLNKLKPSYLACFTILLSSNAISATDLDGLDLPNNVCNGSYQIVSDTSSTPFGSFDYTYDGDLTSIYDESAISFNSPFNLGTNGPVLNTADYTWSSVQSLSPSGVESLHSAPDTPYGDAVVYTFKLSGTAGSSASVKYEDSTSHDTMLVAVENAAGEVLAQQIIYGDGENDISNTYIQNQTGTIRNTGTLNYTYPASGAAYLRYYVIDLGGGYGSVMDGGCLAPTIAISASEVSNGDTSGDSTIALTFTASEDTADFISSDVAVTNGSLSNFSGSGSTYTATLTPSASGTLTINIATNTFTGLGTNNNLAATAFNWTYVADSTAPTISIQAAEVSDGDSSNDPSLTLTFTASEATSNFAASDITVTNGTLSNFTAVSATVYTAIFTPTKAGPTTVDVAGTTFTDGVGNDNIAANQFNWTYGADPTRKADVIGSVNAAANSAKAFSRTSIKSVEMRLDWLRRHKNDVNKSVQGVKVAFADPLLQQFVNGDPRALDAFKLVSAQDVLQKYGTNPNQTMSDVQALPMELAMGEAQKKFGKVDLNPIGGNVIGDWYVWTAGQVTIGKHESSDGSVSNESEALNLAIGMDKSDADSILGFAVNGSKDTTDIGTDGSKQKSYGLSLSIYSGINTEALPPMEFILGAGHMNISSTRIDGSQTLTGSRDAKTIFGSIGILSEAIERGKATITPYSKLEAAYIDLGGYSETGGNLALAYEKQIVKQAMVKLGVDASYDATLANGNLTPFTRLEYAYDISPSSNADMHYVGDGTNYRLTNDKNAMSIWSARIGADYIHSSGASTSFYYERSESINSGYSDSIQLKLSVPF